MNSDREDRLMRAFRVVGRVQGVGFRQWTRRTAERLGLAGSVRNLPDGSVEVQALGNEEPLRLLEEELHRGPLGARGPRRAREGEGRHAPHGIPDRALNLGHLADKPRGAGRA